MHYFLQIKLFSEQIRSLEQQQQPQLPAGSGGCAAAVGRVGWGVQAARRAGRARDHLLEASEEKKMKNKI